MQNFRFLNLTSFINLEFSMSSSESFSFRLKYLSELVTSMLIEDLLLKLFVELKLYSESNELNNTIFSFTISKNANNSKVVPQTILYRILSICASIFFLINIAGNSRYICFAISNSLHHFIWWWLSVEYKLVQNIKYVSLIVFTSNYFEFTNEGTWS